MERVPYVHFEHMGTSDGTISSLFENMGGGGVNRLKKAKFLHPETSLYHNIIQKTDLSDNDFPAKNVNISQ